MDQQNRMVEQLSALMDGELSGEELDRLLAAIESHPELRQQWASHHAARQLLFEKGGGLDPATHGAAGTRFADRLSARLEGEPPLLAPQRKEGRKQGGGVRGSGWVPYALAASLAVVAFLVVEQTNIVEPQPAQVAESAPRVVAGVETEWVEVDGAWVERLVTSSEQAARVRSYLVRHDENRGRGQNVASLVSTAQHPRDESRGVVRHIIGWRAGWLPDGYSRVDTLQHEIPAFGGAVDHLVLSNGADVFSIFVEKSAHQGVTEKQMERRGRELNIYSHSMLGHRITVLGELPMEVIRQVATSVEAERG